MSPWITAIGTAIGLTGATATAAGAAVVGAGVGLAASDISNLVKGNYPWSNPKEFFVGGLKGAGIGGATAGLTAGLGSAIGPALGAVGADVSSAAGGTIGEGTGTIAAEAGAQLPQSLSGVLPSEASGALNGGVSSTGDMLAGTLEKAGVNTLGGAVQGAANDQQNPLRGALSGAAGSMASGALNWAGTVGYRGMASGLGGVPSANDATRGFSLGSDGFTQNAVPRSPQYSLMANQIATPAPTLAERLGSGAVSMGSKFGGNMASSAVRSSLTPPPTEPPRVNPYERYGYTPYWARYQQ